MATRLVWRVQRARIGGVGLAPALSSPGVLSSRPLHLQRAYSTQTPPPPPAPSSPPPPQQPESALSPRLQRYAPRLAKLAQRTGVPLPTLAVSFLVLHELTAVLPVVGLYYLFAGLGAGAGIVGWLVGDAAAPAHWEAEARTPGAEDKDREEEQRWTHTVHAWYAEGLARAERVGRQYGLFGYEKGSKPGEGGGSAAAGTGAGAAGALADAVAAYVVVKALLPLRIAVSVAAAPAFARLALRPWRALTARLRRST
ncbi:uncharacterized protein LOC62_01G001119 [Vanrija pseudolonga]|uniref:Uncharacterized protein n=1 Tax=Vanrija pseudolonga TaxID=143232 RepID=A0AAF0Y0H2_9TREE|nr:hypothetical protein LOC62_01G001119 [Vanrija pseudolonga]